MILIWYGLEHLVVAHVFLMVKHGIALDSRDGLVNNTISAIYGANGNKVWLGSWQGITTYVPKRESSDMYLKEVITPQKTYTQGDLSSVSYSVVRGNRITLL